jgi:hypothetical protein
MAGRTLVTPFQIGAAAVTNPRPIMSRMIAVGMPSEDMGEKVEAKAGRDDSISDLALYIES